MQQVGEVSVGYVPPDIVTSTRDDTKPVAASTDTAPSASTQDIQPSEPDDVPLSLEETAKVFGLYSGDQVVMTMDQVVQVPAPVLAPNMSPATTSAI
jgi:hypothetical protein